MSDSPDAEMAPLSPTKSNDNECFEIETTLKPAAEDQETNNVHVVHVDDVVDADLSSSAPKKNNQKPRKKNTCLSGAGVANARLALAVFAIGGTIGVITGLYFAPNRGGTSTQLQLAPAIKKPTSKSGKGMNEFEVCIFNPLAGIFSFFAAICPTEPFDLPDEKDFYHEWKKYTRRCNGFWGDVIFSIIYNTVLFVNTFVCQFSRRGRALKVVVDNVVAPLTTRALEEETESGFPALYSRLISTIQGILGSFTQESYGEFLTWIGETVPDSTECNVVSNRISDILSGETTIGDLISQEGMSNLANDLGACYLDAGWQYDDILQDVFCTATSEDICLALEETCTAPDDRRM